MLRCTIHFINIVALFLLLGLCVSSDARANTDPVKLRPRILNYIDDDLDSGSYVLPFSRAGNLILVQAKVDSIEGNFVLDTGCPHLVLNITYFRNYRVQGGDEQRNGATGSEFTAAQTLVSSFRFGNFEQYNIAADLANLGNIENSKGVKIIGLIGIQLLEKFEMIIDYEKNFIYLHRIGKKEASTYRHEMLMDTSQYHTIPFSLTDNKIMVQAILAGKKLKLIIDSGAETNMLDSRLPERVFEQVSITGRTVLSGAGSVKLEVLKGDIKDFAIGPQRIGNMPVLITNLEKTCFSYGGCVDGILGFDFLSLKRIGFNFVTSKMFIWK